MAGEEIVTKGSHSVSPWVFPSKKGAPKKPQNILAKVQVQPYC